MRYLLSGKCVTSTKTASRTASTSPRLTSRHISLPVRPVFVSQVGLLRTRRSANELAPRYRIMLDSGEIKFITWIFDREKMDVHQQGCLHRLATSQLRLITINRELKQSEILYDWIRTSWLYRADRAEDINTLIPVQTCSEPLYMLFKEHSMTFSFFLFPFSKKMCCYILFVWMSLIPIIVRPVENFLTHG